MLHVLKVITPATPAQTAFLYIQLHKINMPSKSIYFDSTCLDLSPVGAIVILFHVILFYLCVFYARPVKHDIQIQTVFQLEA